MPSSSSVASRVPQRSDTGGAGDRTAAILRRSLRWLRTGDLALAYAVIVIVIAIVLSFASPVTHHRMILDVSTNLENLRRRPLSVLVESAFVVSSLRALSGLPMLIVLYTVCQRWVGRLATAFVVVLGHVGATLFVATLLASGITRGRLSRSIARVSDVGVSYGTACVAAFIVSRVPRHWRPWYVAALVAYYGGPLIWSPTFTSVGHATAILLGFGVATIVHKAARHELAADEVALASCRPDEEPGQGI